MSLSSIPDAKLGFSELDIAVATVVVKRMIVNGTRKGPTNMLLVPPSALAEWYREDAISFLRDQKAWRQRVVAEIR